MHIAIISQMPELRSLTRLLKKPCGETTVLIDICHQAKPRRSKVSQLRAILSKATRLGWVVKVRRWGVSHSRLNFLSNWDTWYAPNLIYKKATLERNDKHLKGQCEVFIEGAVSSNHIEDTLNTINTHPKHIDVFVDSVGGSVNKVLAIIDMLEYARMHGSTYMIHVTTRAYSAASLLAMGRPVQMYQGSQIRIHTIKVDSATDVKNFERLINMYVPKKSRKLYRIKVRSRPRE